MANETKNFSVENDTFAPIELLEDRKPDTDGVPATIIEHIRVFLQVLARFRIWVCDITYQIGPAVIRYEIETISAAKRAFILKCTEDIAVMLGVFDGIRIYPGENENTAVIEVPRPELAPVGLRRLLESPDFTTNESKTNVCLGEDVVGTPVFIDIAKMPHLLIGGACGSGKSVCLNSILLSILCHAAPQDVKMILIDLKGTEFADYKDEPHLFYPLVNDCDTAVAVLNAAAEEMTRRYALLEDAGARDVSAYNAGCAQYPDREKLPRLVIVVDELAELMLVHRKRVERSLICLAQKARAAGIYLILSTQRICNDVITAILKANIPSRIVFSVGHAWDSCTMLDGRGAERLLGRGDMLYYPIGANKPMRVQGAYVSAEEVDAVVKYNREKNGDACYDETFARLVEIEAEKSNKNNTPKKGRTRNSSSKGTHSQKDEKQ